MHLEDMKKLAVMARIDMGDEELESMAHDFDAVFAYVDQIREFDGNSNPESGKAPTDHLLHNIMREDVVTNTTGACTDKILAEMPKTQDGYLKVKQIL
ncbi:MAG: Asp-tRNA(Asn)/Glu-tRNA(Gln) amidotransferase subunit GatC [bacterium]